ncbi:TPA: hypothetical protein RQN15_002187 [Aeromonas hydrophila]|nr:hypothetical protein [Aeromonas hydrophila]
MKEREREVPAITMGDGNSGNSINICGMNLSTVTLIVTVMFGIATFAVKTAMLGDKVAQLEQQNSVMATTIEQHDVIIKGLLPRLDKFDEKQDKTNDALFNISSKLGILEGKNSK